MLEVVNVSKSFKKDNGNFISILNNISIVFPNKGLVFILGKSGSGKTTLLNILESILKPTNGKVLYNNIDVYNTKNFIKDYRKKIIGILFQNYNLIKDLTTYENLLIAIEIHKVNKNRIFKYAKELHLSNLLDKKVNTLSGGEKQRVSFIRSIIHEPKILFCDEPTGALDEKNGLTILNLLKEYSKNNLVIIVTHNEKLINFDNDKIIRIKDGMIYEKNNFE